jgi:hypothetical protein
MITAATCAFLVWLGFIAGVAFGAKVVNAPDGEETEDGWRATK